MLESVVAEGMCWLLCCGGMSEAFGKFWNTPPRVTDDARAGRRDPQTVAGKLSHNIARRWRMDETRARMGSVFFEFLSTRRDTKAKQSRHGRAWLRGFFYVSLVASKLIPVPTET